MEYNNSTVFILPYLGIKFKDLRDAGFVQAYVGNETFDKDWGEHFHIIFSKPVPDFVKGHQYFSYEYEDTSGYGAAFTYPEYVSTYILKPFLRGAFSQMDSAYVDTHFKYRNSTGNYSNAYRICTRDEVLKQGWEDLLDVYLPDNAEVASRPRRKEEILNFSNILSDEKNNVSVDLEDMEHSSYPDVSSSSDTRGFPS